MCKKIRKKADKPPAFLILLTLKLNLKIKNLPQTVRKERHGKQSIYYKT